MQEADGDLVQKTEADFGARVRKTRIEKALTQRELGERVGIDASAVSRLEQGVRAIRLGEAAAIARALNIDIDELTYGHQTPHGQLRVARENANGAMHLARDYALRMIVHYLEIANLFEQNPELFQELEKEEGVATPSTVDEYLDWALTRIQGLFQNPVPSDYVVVSDPKRVARLTDVIAAAFENLVLTEPFNGKEAADDDSDT